MIHEQPVVMFRSYISRMLDSKWPVSMFFLMTACCSAEPASAPKLTMWHFDSWSRSRDSFL